MGEKKVRLSDLIDKEKLSLILQGKAFVVVNGIVTFDLNAEVDPNSKVIVLPKIAGG